MEDEYDRIFRAGEQMELDEPNRPVPPSPPMGRQMEYQNRMPSLQRMPRSGGSGAIAFVIIGVCLIFIGSVFGGMTWVIEPPDGDDYDDYEEYQKKEESYSRMLRWFTFLNEILWVAGALVLAAGLMGVALLNQNIHPNTKIGLLIGAALVLGFMMTNKTGMMGVLSIFDGF